jgi:hypothetical protein
MLQTLTRAATWCMPWAASLIVSASLTYAVTNAAPNAQPITFEALATCNRSDDRMLTYAVTTHRVPADTILRC